MAKRLFQFCRARAVSHAKFSAENDYLLKKALRSENLRLHGAFMWRLLPVCRYYAFLALFQSVLLISAQFLYFSSSQFLKI